MWYGKSKNVRGPYGRSVLVFRSSFEYLTLNGKNESEVETLSKPQLTGSKVQPGLVTSSLHIYSQLRVAYLHNMCVSGSPQRHWALIQTQEEHVTSESWTFLQWGNSPLLSLTCQLHPLVLSSCIIILHYDWLAVCTDYGSDFKLVCSS